MAIIIPYEKKKIFSSKGAFVKPSGEIIYVSEKHEITAREYCNSILEQEYRDARILDMYQKWCLEERSLSDYLTFILSFDKIEVPLRKTIITTNRNPHIRFYNYYLMDYMVNYINKMKYNASNQKFEYSVDFYYDSFADGEAENEINDIKSKVLKKDRHLFFKK